MGNQKKHGTLGIIQVLRLFREMGVGQAKYNNWIMVGEWGGIIIIISSRF